MAIRRRDPCDSVGLPDVRVDLAVNVFQFVQRFDGKCSVMHGNAAKLLKRQGIPGSNLRRAVAHVNLLAVVGESPAFSGIIESPNRPKRVPVIDEALMGLPGQLNDSLIQYCDALAEVLRIDTDFLEHFPRLQLNFAESRFSIQPRALVEKTAAVLQPLRESIVVMRINVNHSIAVYRRGPVSSDSG